MFTEEESRERIPLILRIANRVANRENASVTVRAELAADAVGHVFSNAEKFNPQTASFSTWCHAVLRNRCVTLIRREAVRRKWVNRARDAAADEARRQLDEPPPPSPAEELEEAARRPRLDIVPTLEGHLSPLDRLMVATYAGVLSACGADAVERWCREANCPHVSGLYGIESLPQKQRKQALAALLNMTLDGLRTKIYRAMQRLRESGAGGTQP